MTITADDLRDEFIDFRGFPPLETDIQYLLFLLKHKVLTVKKFTFPRSFQYCFHDLLFDWFPIYEHLARFRDETAFVLFKINQFIKNLEGDWKVGPEILYYRQTGYRSDIGVLLRGSDDYHIVLAVEVGGTEWIKIKDCLLDLPHLEEIWHFPDCGYYFIWRRGKNFNSLPQLSEKTRDWLESLERARQKEMMRWPLYRWG